MNERPLSPHLQIYKPQLTSVLSITHRGTGIFLSSGLLLLPFWFLAAVAGEQYYAGMQAIMTAWYGRVLLVVFAFSFFYHLCNGIRHLFWDIGMGLDIKTTYLTGWLTVLAAIVLTVIAVFLGYLV